MIRIAGGTYFEACTEPYWNQLFGSGLRAAAAISQLSDSVELSTYISDKDKDLLESIAASFGFKVNPFSIPQTIRFSYFHGLSSPIITPAIPLIIKSSPHQIQASNILRFGMLEGDAQVNGDRVVYDPQDAFNPRPFTDNGSSAQHLAVVLNPREASLLEKRAGNPPSDDISAIGRNLVDYLNAEVVVVKRGSLGAVVITRSESRNIPAFWTESVWPIGSGDVFAATFAHYWAEKGVDAFEAATQASLATAYYCSSRVLPIPANISSGEFRPAPVLVTPTTFPYTHTRVYLAGPFFTMAQRWMIEESRKYLRRQGFSIFSPFHDVGYGSAAHVVPADIKELHACDVVFAIVDGLDAGTIFEVGYARAIEKPVVAFVQNESEGNLKMLEGTSCEIVSDFVSAIYRTTWAAIAI